MTSRVGLLGIGRTDLYNNEKMKIIRKIIDTVKKIPIKWVLCAFGAAVLFNGVTVSLVSNFNLGILLTCLLGAFLLSWGIFYDTVRARVPRVIRCSVALLLAVTFVFASCLYICGRSDSVTYNEDAMIVLGAGIHGEKLSLTLRNRLDSALEYHKKNPKAVIVVSGGQGPQEDITEALAMERYLIEKGVPADKIIKEEGSTSTKENFAYSKELLDKYFEGDYTVAFVTDDYHVFRASRYASMAGFDGAGHCHSSGKWYLMIPNGIRECLAVIKLVISP